MQRPWRLFDIAVVARLAADVVWVGSRVFGLGLAEVFQAAAHVVSYALLFGVLLWVVARIRQEMVSVVALDTLAVMLTSGLLIRYFAPFPFDELTAMMTLAVLFRPVCDLGLLFLSLAALMTVRRPPFVVLSVVGLLLLLFADGTYLWTRAHEFYELGFAEVFWSGGVMLLGFATLSWGGEPIVRSDHVGNFGVGLFWFGPFSPLLHYGVFILGGRVRAGAGVSTARRGGARGDPLGTELCYRLRGKCHGPEAGGLGDVAGGTLAGADGYLHKAMAGEKILDAVRRIYAGQRVWLLSMENEEEAADRIRETSGEARLTPKEKEVFALVIKRRTNPEIAEELYISLYTVKNHVSSILSKLGLKSRREIS